MMITHLGSIFATFMFIWAIFQQYFPYQFRSSIEKYSQRLLTLVYPYIQITFNDFTGERLMRSEAYSAIENYLTSTSSLQAKRLKADMVKNNQSLVLSMDENEEVTDEFQGVKLWKKEIMEDLVTFSESEEFYSRIDRAWKRGYLLYGPPGTGKSTMIAAMANLLGYDIYDLELTAVKDNTELRKLLIETSSKSIIVIEDIDCSLDLTGQRRKKKEKHEEEEEMKDPRQKGNKDEPKTSHVTLSGLLNFIDGLWSACGAFKVLAKNYRQIERYDLFPRIRDLLDQVKITPADVAEHLMPKSASGDPRTCLESLILALESAKQAEDSELCCMEETTLIQGLSENKIGDENPVH
ncbi:xylosyltransferase-like [Hibiscus syriacus]|uniref:Xylosyltransferase-like n=1 Tax=Hibiscus syriacus TaxID=106335 RepID=A0A6A3A0C6_HIBSY|nr:xylosyltransferase-like [Hibiscus syriacus]